MNSSIQPLQGISFVRKIDELSPENPQGQDFAKTAIIRGFSAIESLIEGKSTDDECYFCVGKSITVADLFLGPQVENAVARFGVNMQDFPKIVRVVKSLDDLVEVRQAKPLRQKDTPSELPGFLKKN